MNPVTSRFIQDSGMLTQSLGLGRALGQVYAYLYFSPHPRTLDDMVAALGISKGSASMVVRQLEQWGAAHRMSLKGDRKDYYRADDYFGRIARNLVAGILGARMESLAAVLDSAERDLDAKAGENGEVPFLRERVAHIRQFHRKVQKVWRNPVVRRMVR